MDEHKNLTRKISRRAFIGASLSAMALAPLSASAFSFTTSKLELTQLVIPLPAHCHGLEGFKIVFVSDLHIGPALDLDLLHHTFEMIKAQNPDLLVLGGDFLWIPDSIISTIFSAKRHNEFDASNNAGTRRLIFSLLREYLDKLEIPHGIVSIYGNHDRWSAPAEMPKYLKAKNLFLLSNDHKTLSISGSELQIYGVDDYWTGLPKRPQFQHSSPNRGFRLLLSHNPDYLFELHKNKVLDCHLALCGHTHGGQIRLPLVDTPFYNVRYSQLAEGLNMLGNTAVITTRGVGVVEIPHRINCPAEIVSVVLSSAAPA